MMWYFYACCCGSIRFFLKISAWLAYNLTCKDFYILLQACCHVSYVKFSASQANNLDNLRMLPWQRCIEIIDGPCCMNQMAT